jgi:hypothetical protein
VACYLSLIQSGVPPAEYTWGSIHSGVTFQCSLKVECVSLREIEDSGNLAGLHAGRVCANARHAFFGLHHMSFRFPRRLVGQAGRQNPHPLVTGELTQPTATHRPRFEMVRLHLLAESPESSTKGISPASIGRSHSASSSVKIALLSIASSVAPCSCSECRREKCRTARLYRRGNGPEKLRKNTSSGLAWQTGNPD